MTIIDNNFHRQMEIRCHHCEARIYFDRKRVFGMVLEYAMKDYNKRIQAEQSPNVEDFF